MVNIKIVFLIIIVFTAVTVGFTLATLLSAAKEGDRDQEKVTKFNLIMSKKMKVYICSPLRGDIERNITRAQGYCRDAVDMGVLPIAPHVYFTQFLNDTIPEERDAGMKLGIELLKDCDEVWVYGIQNPSEGMSLEIKLAKEIGIPVRDAAEVYKLYQRFPEIRRSDLPLLWDKEPKQNNIRWNEGGNCDE